MIRSCIACLLAFLLLASCGVPRSTFNELTAYSRRLKNDSALQEKRIRQLNDERDYMGNRSATMEQALTQRLQEKEDSLNHKEQLLSEKENNIRDMKARKAEEKEAFETLARSVFELFRDYPPTDVIGRTTCTQIIVEASDKLLFVPNTPKPDPAKAQLLLIKITKAIEKNPDLHLMVVAHTDSTVHVKDRQEDNWTSGSVKANAIVRALQRDYHISASRLSSATRAETVLLSKANGGIGRNRIEFVFYSTLLPCIHARE